MPAVSADAPTTEEAAARGRDDGDVPGSETREMREAAQERYPKAVLQMARTDTAGENEGALAYPQTRTPPPE